jgi:hypothetical protein
MTDFQESGTRIHVSPQTLVDMYVGSIIPSVLRPHGGSKRTNKSRMLRGRLRTLRRPSARCAYPACVALEDAVGSSPMRYSVHYCLESKSSYHLEVLYVCPRYFLVSVVQIVAQSCLLCFVVRLLFIIYKLAFGFTIAS